MISRSSSPHCISANSPALGSPVGETIIGNKIKELDYGNTRKVADKIKEYTESDLFEIIPVNDYPRSYEDCLVIAKKEAKDDLRPEYVKKELNIDNYDVIYLGYPIWEGSYPRIMASFLADVDFKGKIVKPFSTHGGSNSGYSDMELKGMIKNGKVKEVLALNADKIVADDIDELIGWVFDY